MNNLLNVNQELQKLEYHVQRINKCTEALTLVEQEQVAKQQSNQMNIMIVLSTIYTIVMICMRMIGNKILETQWYFILAILLSLSVYLVTTTFPTKHMKNIGSICMLAVALASLTPVLPDILAEQFSSMPAFLVALVRVISMPVILVTWIVTVLGDRNRYGRLKKIWTEIKED